MSTITASAPGKLMLFGEHAVVYGYPCIVTAVNLRMQVSARVLDADTVTIHTQSLSEPFVIGIDQLAHTTSLPREVRFVIATLKQFWEHIDGTFGVGITTQSDFSESYGLGSSSAVTVAATKALAQAVNCDIGLDHIFRLSYAAVLDAQEGIGSGFDVAAATYGGTLYYVTGGKAVRPLSVDELPLVIGYSGIKASTTKYVRKVANLRERFPDLVSFIMENIESIVDDANQALEQSDYERLGQLMNLNQGYLHALGVGTYELDFLIHGARLNGAYGAKLSGAGGGDCMVALVNDESRPKVESAIRQSGIPNAHVIPVETGAEGVRIE